MIKSIFFVVKFFLIIFVVLWCMDHPGSVFITWENYKIHLSLNFVLFSIVFIYSALFLITMGSIKFRAWLKKIKDNHQQQKQEKWKDHLQHMATALAFKDFKEAKKQGELAFKLFPDDMLTALMMAIIPEEERPFESMKPLLEIDPKHMISIKIQIEDALKQDNLSLAESLVKQGLKEKAEEPFLLRFRLFLYLLEKQWKEALKLLKQMTSEARLPKETLKRIEAMVWYYWGQDDKEHRLKYFKNALDVDPEFYPAVESLLPLLKEKGKTSDLTSYLEGAWKKKPNFQLGLAYCETKESSIDQAKLALKLKNINNTNGIGDILCLLTHIRAHLWGETHRRMVELKNIKPAFIIPIIKSIMAKTEKQDYATSLDKLVEALILFSQQTQKKQTAKDSFKALIFEDAKEKRTSVSQKNLDILKELAPLFNEI